jgi:hypothetical protein
MCAGEEASLAPHLPDVQDKLIKIFCLKAIGIQRAIRYAHMAKTRRDFEALYESSHVLVDAQ